MHVVPDSWEGVVAVAIFVFGTIATAWITRRAGNDDSEDVGRKLQEAVNLAPTVALFTEKVQVLQEAHDKAVAQIGVLTERVSSMEDVVHVRYPASLETIKAFQAAAPDAGVVIPASIRPDLAT